MFRPWDGPAPPLRPMVASDGRMHSTGEQPLDHIASVHHTHSACFARCLDNGLSMKKVAKRVLRRCRHLSSGTDDGAVVGLERTVIAAYSAGQRCVEGIGCQRTDRDRGGCIEPIVLNDDDGSRLAGIDTSCSSDADVASPHSAVQSTEMASTKAWSSASCSLAAMAADWR